KRMNTDTLGGNSIDPTVVTTAVIANQTSSVASQGSVNATAVAADKITLQYANFSQGMKDFVSANGGGTFTVSDTTNWAMDSNNNLYTKTATVEAAGTHKVDVTYSSGTNTFKDTVTIVVAANSSTAAIKASTSNISVAETSAATINAVTANGSGAVTSTGDLSAELKAFVLADSSGGKFTLEGDDAGFFTVSNTLDATFGAITSSGLDKEATGAAADNDNDDVFEFKLVYTSSTGDVFNETVNLTVTDLAESTWKIAAPTTTATTGDKYSVIVNGTEIKTASFSSGSGDFSAAGVAGIVSALNTANGNLGSPLAGAFSVSGSDILWTWNETNPAGSGTISGLYKHAAADAGSTISTADGDGSSSEEAVTFAGAVATLTPLTKGDKIAITLANGKYVETTAIGETGFASAGNNPTAAEILTALNTAASAVSAGGAFTLANANADLVFTYTTGDYTNYGAQTDFKKITISGTDSGSTINAENTITGVAHGATSSITVGTPSTTSATATLNGNYASRGSTDHEITKASTVVTLPESGKISLDKAVLSAGFNAFVTNAAHANGKYSLSGTDAKYFSVDQSTGVVKNELNMDYETKNSFDFILTYTDSSAKTFDETVNLKLTDSTADSGTHLADLNITTQSAAAAAVTILDTALNQISASQAELGAVQNRLQHNIDNLSMGSMLTETARGRIVDADFAKETSE
ncbi:flagellin, partial [Alphaproteobacteria bacterium]|nr:flagellin [Alphaproteobacteria bacterium]